MPAFDQFRDRSYPHQFTGKIRVATIAGGVPSDSKVAEGWLKTKLADRDDLVRDLVASTMIERGITAEQAAEVVTDLKHLNGFKRDETGLYIEGRQLKAAIKEAASVAVAAGKLNARGWGTTNKGCVSFVAEHIFVTEDRLPLGVTEPTGIVQRFVHTWRGTGIQYEEYVENADIEFTVVADHKFSDEEWAMIWLTGEQQGIGASRSQGFGRYSMTEWTAI